MPRKFIAAAKALNSVAIILFIILFHSSRIFSIEQQEIMPQAASQSASRTLSLKDSVDIALINNKTLQIQKEEIEYARGDILYANSRFLPQVAAEYDYKYTASSLTLGSSVVSSAKKDPGIFLGYQNDNSFSILANESVYNGGANLASLEQARLNLKIQQETLRAAKLNIEFETKRLFYGLLLAYETYRIADDLVEQAKKHLKQTEDRFGQGTASKFDVLQSKVQVSRLIPQLVNAQNAIELIIAEFKKLLSLDLNDNIQLKGELAPKFIEIKEDNFLKEAYQKKPEIILKALGVDLNKWGIEFARAGWLPQLNLQAGYTVRSNNPANMFNSRHDNWTIGVTGGIAIFDGFATKAKVDEAKVRYTQAILQKEDVIEQTAVDLKDACLNMKQARAIIVSQQDSVDEAKEALRLAEVRFENGVGTNLDVFDSEVALAEVEQNLSQGIYDYIMARAQLDKTLGREFYKEE